MVSRAFQILSDAEKKARYDQFGGDPDSRFGGASSPSAGASPFSGFARSQGRGPMFDDEISPEELFNRFFAGGGFGGPFGMRRFHFFILRKNTNTAQKEALVALSLSSTWAADPASQSIEWAAATPDEDHEMARKHRQAGWVH